MATKKRKRKTIRQIRNNKNRFKSKSKRKRKQSGGNKTAKKVASSKSVQPTVKSQQVPTKLFPQ